MSATPAAATTNAHSTTNKTTSPNKTTSTHDQFMQLMLKELTQQDPLKPMSTSEMANQMLSLEQVSTTENLQKQLENLSNVLMMGATGLVGKSVTVLDPNTQQEVTGTVQALRSKSGQLSLMINGQSYPSEYLRELR
jgi:flagellar basal-body rod modification protein FlgD|eukprot:TRINITY_DN80033_c0_g1_i1.p1 TRINITY_DN80033_c0_g1~~TRINITY_DN80033_c0_g1_i1.p1  ORF type:complete len:137 (+),score=29.87 TRINITY_DN80033_c0_g1_i1:64-474(+)